LILALEGKERVWGMEAGKSPEKNQSNESSHIKWKITTGHEHETVKEDWQARSWETRKKLENQMKKRREAKRQQNNYGQNTWASHFHYLRECFQDQIGLPIWEPWQAPILSWNNVKIAKGYERVALTWQGIFWEVTRKDILFDNLTELVNREEGMRKWVTNGVTVYQFQDGYNHVLRRHRFAVVPPTSDKVCRGDLRPDRYYIHVYQTRVQTSNGDLKWLRSKEIAKHLWRTWGNSYYPRRQDIRKEPESYEQSRRKKRQRNINPEPHLAIERRAGETTHQNGETGRKDRPEMTGNKVAKITIVGKTGKHTLGRRRMITLKLDGEPTAKNLTREAIPYEEITTRSL